MIRRLRDRRATRQVWGAKANGVPTDWVNNPPGWLVLLLIAALLGVVLSLPAKRWTAENTITYSEVSVR